MELIEVSNSKVLQKSSDIEELKAQGKIFAIKKGVTDPVWQSNIVMGDTPLTQGINTWFLFNNQTLILRINM